jgi:NAD(P)-dependent dehydrogenase (short-subunit alcohol dehydrogenase family)
MNESSPAAGTSSLSGVPAGPRSLSGVPAVVTGASRGFGRAIAVALAEAGATVAGVARDAGQLAAARAAAGPRFVPVVADAADPVSAARLIDQFRPALLVLCAGASPLARPLHRQTWESFSRPWEVDVQQVFHWSREALLAPLEPGATVIAFSSGAARFGSPLSGGYAGAKATIRFMAAYAAGESQRAGLGIRFTAVLPDLTPATGLGAAAVAAYAARQGIDEAAFLAARGPVLQAGQVGQAIARLAADPGLDGAAYALSAGGLAPLE